MGKTQDPCSMNLILTKIASTSTTVHKTNEKSTSSTPQYRNGFLSPPGKQIYAINNGGKHTEPGSLNIEKRKINATVKRQR